ncbi:MAG TPA: hypothetical protein VFA40_19280 [Terriglobales bacterium]|nr:hypothetical protein [Terriglobales bacterium]
MAVLFTGQVFLLGGRGARGVGEQKVVRFDLLEIFGIATEIGLADLSLDLDQFGANLVRGIPAVFLGLEVQWGLKGFPRKEDCA